MEADNDRTESFVPLTKGAKVGHYTIVSKLGAGGMGEVYLAEDTELKRQVALKFLPFQFLSDENAKARFKREAQAAAKLNHPNIVTIHEVSEYQGRPFFAMECCDGKPLRDILKEKELSIEEAVNLAIQICEGLDKAHNAGIVHRDIKPSNIIIDSDGRAKLLDFGLATVKGTEKLTQTGSTLGTIGYMSPEQIEVKEADQRSDLFSLGVVLYEMITGRLPFKGDTDAATLNSILNDTAEPLSRYKSNVPEQLEQIISKLLEKNISYRYQSAAGVLSDLKRLSSKSLQPAKRIDKRNRFVVPSAVIALIAIFVIWKFVFQDKTTSSTDTEKIMLAVLPFENLGHPEDEYFADGMTDEITAKLAIIRDLRVTSRTSAMQFKGVKKSIRQIGNELGVDYILEGTIRWDKSGDTSRVRITPQLIKVTDDAHLWANTYERPLTQVFAVQSDIAEHVVQALNVNLLSAEMHNLRRAPTNSMGAYDYYLRGRELYHLFRNREDLDMAAGLLENAVSIDTTFVLALAELSFIHSTIYWFGYDRSNERQNKAWLAAERAMGLDSSSALAHCALGFCYYYFERDFSRALLEFNQAHEKNPGEVDVLAAIGYIKRRIGEWDESFEYQKRALRLDPLSSNIRSNLAETARIMRRYDDAKDIAGRGLELFPDNMAYYTILGGIFLDSHGDVNHALQLLDSAPSGVIRSNSEELYMRWWYNLLLRQYDVALAFIKKYIETCQTAEDTANCLVNLAETYHLLGQVSKSRAYYDTARVYIETLLTNTTTPGTFLPPSLGLVYSRLGEKVKAVEAARRDTARVSLSDDTYLGAEPLVDLAITYARVGEKDKASDLIDTLLSIPSSLTVAILKLDPNFDPLRHDPRFQALIKKYEGKESY